MAAAAILKNRKSAISPERFDQSSRNLVRWRILGLRMGPEVEIFNFWKSKMAEGCHLEKLKKSPYLSRVLSDFDKIWHVDAVRTCWASEPLKIWIFQNPRWRPPPSWKIENRPYLRNGLTNLREIWYGDAYWASEWDRKLKFLTFENPRWRTAAILKNWKIAISQPHFERFRQNLARGRSSNLLSVRTVKNLKFPKS